MRLRRDLYYFCRIGKDPHIIKIRRCCAAKGCPHLGVKPRKNYRQKGDSGAEENVLTRMPWLRQDQAPRQIPLGNAPAFNILQESA